MYDRFRMKRVFYSAYVGINENSRLPAVGTMPLLLSEHRLYQADWLMWFYGFKAAELLSEKRPNFNLLLDPKCDWAVRHLENFPVGGDDGGLLCAFESTGVRGDQCKTYLPSKKIRPSSV